MVQCPIHCKELKGDYEVTMTSSNNENMVLNIDHLGIIKIWGSYIPIQSVIIKSQYLSYLIGIWVLCKRWCKWIVVFPKRYHMIKLIKASGHFLWLGDGLVIAITLNTFGLGSHSNNMHSSCFTHEALWFVYCQHPFTCVHKSYVVFNRRH